MTGYFLIGFTAGISLAIIFIISKIYNYRKEVNLARRNIDRLEKFIGLLQFELKNSEKSADGMAGLSI